jgi:hypothetical protein
VDRTRVSSGDKLIGISALALFAFSFLPWFKFEKEFSHSGWHSVLFGVVPIALALATFALVVVGRFLPRLAELPGRLDIAAGAIAAALILVKLILGDKVNAVVQSVRLHPQFGLYLSLLAALGVAVGGLVKERGRTAA